jgi:hypothetical protein
MKRFSWSFRGSRVAVAGMTIVATWLTGCATTGGWKGMSHGTTATHMQEVRTIAALPAEITVNQLGAGGISEKRDDWTEAARTHARVALENFRPGSIVYVSDLDSRPELADEIREVRALASLIDLNFALFGLSPMAVPGPRQFDFSVGSIDRILEAGGGDALLVINGVDEIFTTDRKVLSVVSLVASAALTGSAVMPGSGQAHVSAVLIARNGTILWWNFVGDGMISDLRTPQGVETTLKRLLEPLPATGTTNVATSPAG